GVVLGIDGKPASGAQVALLSLDHNVRLQPTHTFEGNKRWLVRCNPQGEFQFPASRSAHSVAAVSRDGYEHVRVVNVSESVTLQLKPWGRVEGTVDPAAKAHPVETI